MISFENIAVRRGSRAVLQGVHGCLLPGQVLAVLGPNGSGKSTLLKTLARELHPVRGTLTYDGECGWLLSSGTLARRFAVLPQSASLAFDFEVLEVVLMGRLPHRGRSNPTHDREIALAALEAVGLEDFKQRLYPTLSGGERQRVHLARVLAQIWEPQPDGSRYLLLDEPTSSLDLKHQHSTLKLARQFAENGAGVLVVLHDMHLAQRYADAVLMLRKGRCAGFGPTDNMLTPARIQHIFDIEPELIPGLMPVNAQQNNNTIPTDHHDYAIN